MNAGALDHLRYRVGSEGGALRVTVTYKGSEMVYAPELLGGMLLAKLRTLASAHTRYRAHACLRPNTPAFECEDIASASSAMPCMS